MKYIDAEKLIAEIERRKKQDVTFRERSILIDIETAITSLQQEQPNFADTSKMEKPSVEDAMKALNEKIALVKESGTWDVVDVDKYMDKVRGREPEVDLVAEIEMEWDSFNKHLAKYDEGSEDVVWLNWNSFVDIARHFYELGKKSK